MQSIIEDIFSTNQDEQTQIATDLSSLFNRKAATLNRSRNTYRGTVDEATRKVSQGGIDETTDEAALDSPFDQTLVPDSSQRRTNENEVGVLHAVLHSTK